MKIKLFESTNAALNIVRLAIESVVGYKVKLRECDVEIRQPLHSEGDCGRSKPFTITGTVIQLRPAKWKSPEITSFEAFISVINNYVSYIDDSPEIQMKDNYHVHSVFLIKLNGDGKSLEFVPQEKTDSKQREQVICFGDKKFTVW